MIAILLGEPVAVEMAAAIENDAHCILSAANLLEAAIVIESRKGGAGAAELDALVARAQIEIVPVDEAQVEVAREAWRKYGKGRHSAALNYGDCFAYALAKSKGSRLLFAGSDFPYTDIDAVIR